MGEKKCFTLLCYLVTNTTGFLNRNGTLLIVFWKKKKEWREGLFEKWNGFLPISQPRGCLVSWPVCCGYHVRTKVPVLLSAWAWWLVWSADHSRSKEGQGRGFSSCCVPTAIKYQKSLPMATVLSTPHRLSCKTMEHTGKMCGYRVIIEECMQNQVREPSQICVALRTGLSLAPVDQSSHVYSRGSQLQWAAQIQTWRTWSVESLSLSESLQLCQNAKAVIKGRETESFGIQFYHLAYWISRLKANLELVIWKFQT